MPVRSGRNSRVAVPKTSREKVLSYRQRMRDLGMRPIQIWVPDTRSPEFAAEAQRQCRLANKSPHAAEDQAFLASIAAVKL